MQQGRVVPLRSEAGQGIPKGAEAVTLSEAKRMLDQMQLRRVGNLPPECVGLIKYCDMFGLPVAFPGQLDGVRKAVFETLDGFQNPDTPLLGPGVEAAMLANLRPARFGEAEEIVPDFPQRRHVRTGAPPPADILGAVADFLIARR
jgi:hypothetical protein